MTPTFATSSHGATASSSTSRSWVMEACTTVATRRRPVRLRASRFGATGPRSRFALRRDRLANSRRGLANDDSSLERPVLEIVVIVEPARARCDQVAGLAGLSSTEQPHLVDLEAKIV